MLGDHFGSTICVTACHITCHLDTTTIGDHFPCDVHITVLREASRNEAIKLRMLLCSEQDRRCCQPFKLNFSVKNIDHVAGDKNFLQHPCSSNRKIKISLMVLNVLLLLKVFYPLQCVNPISQSLQHFPYFRYLSPIAFVRTSHLKATLCVRTLPC